MPRISTASLAPLPSSPDQPGEAGDPQPASPRCELCGEPQFESPSGITCPNGHGGAGALEPPLAGAPAGEQEPVRRRRRRVQEIQLPGTGNGAEAAPTPPAGAPRRTAEEELADRALLGALVIEARQRGIPLETYAELVCARADAWRRLPG